MDNSGHGETRRSSGPTFIDKGPEIAFRDSNLTAESVVPQFTVGDPSPHTACGDLEQFRNLRDGVEAG
jgi:hypothetical protein